MSRILHGALVALLALALVSGCSDPEPAPEVETQYGDIRGIAEADTLAYRGIPYAAPPVGKLRWERPRPPEPWNNVRDGSDYGDDCPQAPTAATPKNHGASEDCLYLNVTKPDDDREDLPVMVWFHGGGFSEGTARTAPYTFNSPDLVKRGVVLVTVNYRIGRLGYFAHPALKGDVANFGLLDQVAALRWVRDNVEAFGGDPGNVTIFGQSAGGMSVNALMVTPKARGLFHRAIVQSGAGRLGNPTLDEARKANERLFPADDRTELRSIDAEALAAEPPNVLTGEVPILDKNLPVPVEDAFSDGDEVDVPYLIGTNSFEYPDLLMEQVGIDPDELRGELTGPLEDEAFGAYDSDDEARESLITDAIFTEPARNLATAHAGRADTYRYRFSVNTGRQFYPAHGAELPFTFDSTDELPDPPPDAGDIADDMADYWVAFARTGDPNHGDATTWPSADDGEFLDFTNEGPEVVDDDPRTGALDVLLQAAED